MQVINKDILTIEKGIICQQVNCKSVQGKGLALQIKNKWPTVTEQYHKYCECYKNDFELLGNFHFVNVCSDLWICNIFGQLDYARRANSYNSERYTDYGALNTAFNILSQEIESLKTKDIYFPYLFGCGLANGDWNIVSKMIEYYFPAAIICKLPEKSQCHVHTFVTKDKCGCDKIS